MHVHWMYVTVNFSLSLFLRLFCSYSSLCCNQPVECEDLPAFKPGVQEVAAHLCVWISIGSEYLWWDTTWVLAS